MKHELTDEEKKILENCTDQAELKHCYACIAQRRMKGLSLAPVGRIDCEECSIHYSCPIMNI